MEEGKEIIQSKKPNKKLIILSIVMLLAGVGFGVGGALLLKNNQSTKDDNVSQKEERDKTEENTTKNEETSTTTTETTTNTNTSTASDNSSAKIAELQKKVAELEKANPTGRALNDQEALEVLTISRGRGSVSARWWMPIVHSIVGDYASTSPLPMEWRDDAGYQVVGVGGVTFFWHKVNGVWKYVGMASEGGYNMEPGYTPQSLPKEFTH